MTKTRVAKQTRLMWLINAPLLFGAVIAALSGIYFLFLPVGGFQGGRNPWYGVTVLFSRHTWGDLHTWASVVVIVAAAIHLVVHWDWVKRMTRRLVMAMKGQSSHMNKYGWFNLAINALVGISFLVTALSGIYFLFVPGSRRLPDPMFLVSRTTWDLMHTWAGVVLIAATVIHFAIHWRWVVKVTGNMFRMIRSSETASLRQNGATVS